MTDRDPKPANEPAISRALTPSMPEDELASRLAIERLVAELERQRAAIRANTFAPRPSRGRR